MTKPQNPIDDLFKDGLKNLEPEVNSEILNNSWDKISNQIGNGFVKPSNGGPKSSIFNKLTFKGASLLNKIIFSSVVVATISTVAIWVANSLENSPVENTTQTLSTDNETIDSSLNKDTNNPISQTSTYNKDSINKMDLVKEQGSKTNQDEKLFNKPSSPKTQNRINNFFIDTINSSNAEDLTVNRTIQSSQNVNKEFEDKMKKNIDRSIVLSENIVCIDEKIELNLLDIDRNYMIDWGTKIENKVEGGIHQHTYSQVGDYTISVFPENIDYVKKFKVSVTQRPKAKISLLDCNKLSCTFYSESNANILSWYIKELNVWLQGNNISYTFPDSGTYTLRLAAIQNKNCIDTQTRIIRVSNFEGVKVAQNIITVNNDGLNEELVIDAEPLAFFQLSVLNNVGEEVFSSYSVNNRWNGNYINGLPCKTGSYRYVIKYKTLKNNKIQYLSGSVELVR
jgi:hypothetical protein